MGSAVGVICPGVHVVPPLPPAPDVPAVPAVPPLAPAPPEPPLPPPAPAVPPLAATPPEPPVLPPLPPTLPPLPPAPPMPLSPVPAEPPVVPPPSLPSPPSSSSSDGAKIEQPAAMAPAHSANPKSLRRPMIPEDITPRQRASGRASQPESGAGPASPPGCRLTYAVLVFPWSAMLILGVAAGGNHEQPVADFGHHLGGHQGTARPVHREPRAQEELRGGAGAALLHGGPTRAAR